MTESHTPRTLPLSETDQLSAGATAYETKLADTNDVEPAQYNAALLDSSSSVLAGFNQPSSGG